MTILHEEGALTQRVVPGPSLYVVTTMPASKPKAVVGLLHGYGDHVGRYQHVADAFAERGIGTVALDLRGHGRASGQRGYCSRFDDYLDDAAELARLVRERAEHTTPMFFLGHSFGGLVATASVLEAPRAWRGLILSAPYLGLALDVPAATQYAGRLASRFIPRLALANGLTGAHVTHDRARAKAYDEDPLLFKTATARWFRETELAQERVLAGAASLALPLHVVLGSADPVAKVSVTKQFFASAGSADKTFIEHDTLLHEPFSEYEWPLIADTIASWVIAH